MNIYFKKAALLSVSCILVLCLHAQGNEQVKQHIDSLNSAIDNAVVNKNKAVLEAHYADDFVFTHGTGLIDSKASWISNVTGAAAHFILRQHDSTIVELHNDIAIMYGRLSVQRQDKEKLKNYVIKYVRVFVLRSSRWQMVSHRTVWESDLQ